ncbi:hypothetical protein CQ047_04980 [Microbacterium sp. MYb72]|nr:hypothetical protein CQ047_04980 [Microbacterium sp. MYb72]
MIPSYAVWRGGEQASHRAHTRCTSGAHGHRAGVDRVGSDDEEVVDWIEAAANEESEDRPA